MQTLEFTDEELAVLRDITKRHLHELDVEVLHTDSHDFKEMLKHRKHVLSHVLEKVSASELAVTG
jgi:hypothetical protein